MAACPRAAWKTIFDEIIFPLLAREVNHKKEAAYRVGLADEKTMGVGKT
jgi:hypothetical protein